MHKAYVNGELNDSLPWTNGIFPSTANVNIGYSPVANAFFDGLIDEPTVYNMALSGSDIQAIYNAGSAGKNGAPLISSEPQNQVGYWGQSVTFSVRAVGSDSLSYQWRKGGTEIDGATDSSLVLTNLQAGDAASYSVTVTNSCGSTTSSNAFLTVNPAGVSLALYAGITISGVAGFTYGIQYTTDLANTNSWQGTANVTLNSPTGFWLDVQPASQPQRYYRVVPGPIAIP